MKNVRSGKMKSKSMECIMFSYPKDGKGYRLWDLNEKCIVQSRYVKFQESIFLMKIVVNPTVNDSNGAYIGGSDDDERVD